MSELPFQYTNIRTIDKLNLFILGPVSFDRLTARRTKKTTPLSATRKYTYCMRATGHSISGFRTSARLPDIPPCWIRSTNISCRNTDLHKNYLHLIARGVIDFFYKCAIDIKILSVY